MKKQPKKTTKAEFERFKDRCEDLISVFNLSDWDLFISMGDKWDDGEPLGDVAAMVRVNNTGRIAQIKLHSTNYDSGTPESIATHEMIHIMLSDLESLANDRYVQAKDIDNAVERLTVLLTNLLEDE